MASNTRRPPAGWSASEAQHLAPAADSRPDANEGASDPAGLAPCKQLQREHHVEAPGTPAGSPP
ncbi:hypothetical protein GCM10009663_60300 [Kitasatospora arboriphila]|uniref:Uncharacterized protein n=1 Tax=Kitasatospora arboriphila TaxID=258052 RepID=A0ABP4EIJ3_9ACTN